MTSDQNGKLELLNVELSLRSYHSVRHISQSAREPLGVVAHGPSPHVFGKSLRHVAAARRLGDRFQHGVHLCSSGSGESSS